MKYLVIAVSLLAVLLSGCARKDAAPTELTFLETTAGETASPQTQAPETVPTLAPAEPADEDFVRVADYIPTITQDLRYATENNFTGQRIYDFTQVYLRWGTVKKLMDVSRELEAQGLYLKIWDGFRPVSAQFRLWEVYPDPTFVSNPENGYSSHSRGNTVDLTLVDSTGQELEMPTGFDGSSQRPGFGDADGAAWIHRIFWGVVAFFRHPDLSGGIGIYTPGFGGMKERKERCPLRK